MEARTLYLVKRAETACRSGLETSLSDLGITPSQYTTMSLLATQGQSSADLARRTGVSPQSMSEIINLLERKEFIARTENPEHRRILIIQLTEAGVEMLKRCNEMADRLEAKLLEGIDPDVVATLRSALDRIARNSQS